MKKKTATRITAAFLTAAAVWMAGMPVASDNTDATVQSYEDQLAEIAWKKQQALNELSDIDSDRTNTYNDALKLELRRYDMYLHLFQ